LLAGSPSVRNRLPLVTAIIAHSCLWRKAAEFPLT